MPSEFARHVAEVDPGLYDGFQAQYVHCEFEEGHCLRCGSRVKKKVRKLHRWHHHDLSLAIWTLGCSIKTLVNDTLEEG